MGGEVKNLRRQAPSRQLTNAGSTGLSIRRARLDDAARSVNANI